jgi:hypothetical protein
MRSYDGAEPRRLQADVGPPFGHGLVQDGRGFNFDQKLGNRKSGDADPSTRRWIRRERLS